MSEFSLVSHTLPIHCLQEQKKCVWLHITLIMESVYESCLPMEIPAIRSGHDQVFVKIPKRNVVTPRINEDSKASFLFRFLESHCSSAFQTVYFDRSKKKRSNSDPCLES